MSRIPQLANTNFSALIHKGQRFLLAYEIIYVLIAQHPINNLLAELNF